MSEDPKNTGAEGAETTETQDPAAPASEAPESGESTTEAPADPLAEAQAEAIKLHALLRSLPDRLRGIEDFGLNIEALRDANVAGQAVSAVDVSTWQVALP